jgi:hypothetical protein
VGIYEQIVSELLSGAGYAWGNIKNKRP